MEIVAMAPRTVEIDLPVGAEQRRHPRRVGLETGVLRLAIRPEFRGRRGLLIDVSESGMGFLLAEQVAPGTTFVFELPIPGSPATIARIATVRHNRPHPVPVDAPWLVRTPALSKFFRRLLGSPPEAPRGQAWLVGCEFDRPLHADEIRQLLDPVPDSE